MSETKLPSLAKRFRGYFPIIVDVETGGFDAKTHALLEIAAVTVEMNEQGLLEPKKSFFYATLPFAGAKLDPASLAFTGIIPDHPFRMAVDEKQALTELFTSLKKEMKDAQCKRCVLVGHNAAFDLSFINAACERHKLKSIFHPFTTFDTAALSALALGETVLASALAAAKLNFDNEQAHSALYDAERTAELFCFIVNRWQALGGWG
ncbi:MAG: ribonuclease T [Gammaproteobacteria bacterium]|nr:ribonuclease T [Gammaproteobacteria bacterium]